ncbi:hypothetical protein M378DRAFT_312974 [Amanita muscaria Koide BX008]|uniref:Uncharacterized protein n=1 Tax=Amanita muscaria (strain Koide BX008) TaxID=946122 RepID=A0A0C2WQM4_AMAMK|nr:hypothetical protein M378DRAFT_312974 [Amanita muscaria Koide BX008]
MAIVQPKQDSTMKSLTLNEPGSGYGSALPTPVLVSTGFGRLLTVRKHRLRRLGILL